jgi:ATP-dependent Clp protease ATP-binding subunit ClpA
MANLILLPIWTVSFKFSPDLELISPLLIPQTITVNEIPSNLAKRLIQRLEKSTLEQGQYLETLRYVPDLSLDTAQLQISLPAFRKRRLYPNLELHFDYVYSLLPNHHYLGFVPALGIEGYAATTTELVTILQQAIELEFSRKKRYSSVQQLIVTQWYEKIQIEKHSVDTHFHNLSELPNLHKQKKPTWLPEIAQAWPLTSPDHERSHCFGREKDLEQLLRALTGRYSRHVLLVGRAGVGKSALLTEAYRLGKQQGLGTITFWETTAARLLQKLTAESGWEEALGQALEELSRRGDILYVRNLAQLFEVGAYIGNSISIAEFMREHLSLGAIRLVSECTDEELATIEAKAPGYTHLFQILRLEPPPIIQQTEIISHRLRASHPQQQILTEAIEETLRLQHRYALYSGFPGKTVQFLEALLNQVQLKESEAKSSANAVKLTTLVDRETVVNQFCEESGMPRFLVDSQSVLNLEDTKKFFQTRLFGQNMAIDTVVNLLASVKTRLTRPGKPIASLLFVGPTGVGKTELAKALAEFMFGDSERLIRFDMSEFADEIAVLRLTGDISGKPGLLTDKIRQQPFSVVLLDELEKAHFAFYDLLLQIMGEGRLTDARGQVADFCSSMIIMTSNLGAGISRQHPLGFVEKDRSLQALQQHYLHAVQQFFRPELFNRLDQIVPFNALDLSVLRPIVRRELDKILAREGLVTRHVNLQIAEAVIDYLADLSGHSRYGARQLQRHLQEKIVVPLATLLNRYVFTTTMQIAINLGNQSLEFKTEVYTQKARADQIVPHSKATWRQLTANATRARRIAQQVEEGSAMNKLWSEWDLLERRRRRQSKKFWENHALANEYGALHQLLEDAKRLQQQITTIELDCSLAFIGITDIVTGLTEALSQWQQTYEDWQLRLLDKVHPETGRCVIGIYGEATHLSEIVKVFNYFCQTHNWLVTERAVWIRGEGNKYIYTDHYASPERQNDKLIGREIQITGAGAAIYLRNEQGIHELTIREDEEYPYAVIVSQNTLKVFKTPLAVHRRQFLDGLTRCRLYWKSHFLDFKFLGDTYSGANWLTILEQRLNEDFREAVLNTLCDGKCHPDLDLKFI